MQTSFKSAILNPAEAVRLASINSTLITEAQQRLFPYPFQPLDILTLADFNGNLNFVLREQNLMSSKNSHNSNGLDIHHLSTRRKIPHAGDVWHGEWMWRD
ncbi:hypothetical protein BLNAU_6003 [Blattamonas nauphoetae]|uniref:Uncharacterized protein n=1 Tax=Blattamonas nauphoetae TaxID=2049346 RepID=A0ABQ9Y5G2_9EUKA|nr:hypothetical protein BLNAU_6003 [Blattamonas nauphoetae]